MPSAGMSTVTGMWALPLLAAQAVWVRLSTPRLPEAPAPHTGTTIGGGLLPDRPYRLAVVGESTAASVGVASHDDGLVGNLATQIALRTGRTVAWSVVGRTGATVADVSEQLLPELVAAMPAGPWHLAVVASMAQRGPRRSRTTRSCCALGVAAGQILGGLFVSADVWGLGWPPIFLVNLPGGLVMYSTKRRAPSPTTP